MVIPADYVDDNDSNVTVCSERDDGEALNSNDMLIHNNGVIVTAVM
jgi:hypothetical protein